MTCALVIGLLATPTASGADPIRSLPLLKAAPVSSERVLAQLPRSDSCHSARKALRFYRAAYEGWYNKMGAEVVVVHANRLLPGSKRLCPRYLAKVYRAKAHAARVRFEYKYAWRRWLPAKFYRVARCETGVRWDWDSGTYVSAFGIIRVAYESYHRWTGRNSPREQYEVAAAIQARFGWGAWGCSGA